MIHIIYTICSIYFDENHFCYVLWVGRDLWQPSAAALVYYTSPRWKKQQIKAIDDPRDILDAGIALMTDDEPEKAK